MIILIYLNLFFNVQVPVLSLHYSISLIYFTLSDLSNERQTIARSLKSDERYPPR